MRHYETIYIINPTLPDDEYKGVVEKFNNLLEKEKAVPIKLQEWGKQRLAYLLKKFDRGSYILIEYCGEPGVPIELERAMKLDDRILKFQTVKLGDNVDAQELKSREEESRKGKSAGHEPKEETGEEKTKEAPKEDKEGSDKEVKDGVQ